MTTVLDLISRGYFPRELPPPFQTTDFAGLVAGQRSALPAIPSTAAHWTRCVSHNLARPGALRRPLKIPNPMHFLPLVEEIVAQWPTLVTHFRRPGGHIAASRPLARRTILDRAVVPRLSQRELPRLRARRFAGARYFLRADINQFYPSIYSHSLPWALHTKAYAKAHINQTPGDQLDRWTRAAQDGQTIGIPIGPDTSLILSEIILSSVDAALAGLLLRGIRYVDDYELGFGTLADAEAALNDLQGTLAEYELALNPRKTRITEAPLVLDEAWVTDLNRFPFRGRSPINVNAVIAFFSRAFDWSRQHPEHAVLRYAIVATRNWSFTNGWPTFQGLLYNASTVDPGVLPVVVATLERHLLGGLTLDVPALSALLESIIVRHAPLSHGSEVAWGLWTAIQFGIGLSAATASAVSLMEDDVVALLALDADTRGLFPVGSLNSASWQRLSAEPDSLRREHWLLTYEAHAKGWIRNPNVTAHRFFGVLERNGVSFYDAAARLGSFAGAAAPIPAGRLGPGYG